MECKNFFTKPKFSFFTAFQQLYIGLPGALLSLSSKNNKNSTLKKSSYIFLFQEMELSGPKIKKLHIYIFLKKLFLYFRKLNPLKTFYISGENFRARKIKKPAPKKFLMFTHKIRNFLIFYIFYILGTCKAQKAKISYIFLKRSLLISG